MYTSHQISFRIQYQNMACISDIFLYIIKIFQIEKGDTA